MMRDVLHLKELQSVESPVPVSRLGSVLTQSGRWRDQAVLVKTLVSDDPSDVARFRHEGAVAESLAHPRIVPLLAVTPRQLIFPFITGGSLREYLDGTQLDADQATAVTLGVLSGAAYLHRCGVVHQDLKPENVMLAGGEPTAAAVRIVDFGMSHARNLPLDIHSGTRMGTPHFMAPEQFQGVRGDPRSDLYSAGVLLFDALAGHPPYEDALGWLAGIRDNRAALPGPAALHPVMLAALARDPDERPGSAGEMIEAIQAAREALGLGRVTGLDG
jgi:serine/threonine-protein kinase